MYHQNGMEFSEWIVDELEQRGWSRSEAARRGDISPSMFDKVINGYAKPGKKFLDGIALAFELPQTVVYRRAGMLEPAPDKTELIEQILHETEDIPEIDQQEAAAAIEQSAHTRRVLEQLAVSVETLPDYYLNGPKMGVNADLHQILEKVIVKQDKTLELVWR